MKDIANTENGHRIRSLLEKGAWHTSFVEISMLFFLCMISSLMMIAVLSNFALSYHNHYLLIEIRGNESRSETINYTTVISTWTTETDSTTETATTNEAKSETNNHTAVMTTWTHETDSTTNESKSETNNFTTVMTTWTTETDSATETATTNESKSETNYHTAVMTSWTTETDSTTNESKSETNNFTTVMTTWPTETDSATETATTNEAKSETNNFTTVMTTWTTETDSATTNEATDETSNYTTVMTTLTIDNETNSTTETATTDFDLPMSTSDVPKRSPIVILNEVSPHRQSYQCRLVCSSPIIYSALINVTLSAKGANFLCLEIAVHTTNKIVAKRRVAYETIKYLHPEYLNSSMTDDEWNDKSSCEKAIQPEQIWRKCS